MECPCKNVRIVIDNEFAEKELDSIYEQYPDSEADIWDILCCAEMALCDDCLVLEEYARVNDAQTK